MNACEACKTRGKTWNGDDPKCGFATGQFSADNWNCATVVAVRKACGSSEYGSPPRHPRVDYSWDDDQSTVTIDLSGINLPTGPATGLWLTWYKNRGATEEMWLIDGDDSRRLPTEADCLAAVRLLGGPRPA